MQTGQLAVLTLLALPSAVLSQSPRRFNPVVELLEQKKAVFGVYAPANRRGRGGVVPADAPPPKTPAELAKEALAYARADYLFDGSMEGRSFDTTYASFAEFVKGMHGNSVEKSPSLRLHHPLFVKMHRIAPDPAVAAQHIARQLDLGVSGVVFVDVNSPEEVKAGLAAMRFKSNGGTRPDAVGSAPTLWGMSEKEYKEKADVWPLNPKGELVNFTIVESKEGLARVREIAAVKGIGVLLPGAGTLRQVFSTTDSAGNRKFDAEGWEAAIQKVLAACKEFNVACGYPANASDIETRMKQGFSVFLITWGDAGFQAVEIGRKVAGRP